MENRRAGDGQEVCHGICGANGLCVMGVVVDRCEALRCFGGAEGSIVVADVDEA